MTSQGASCRSSSCSRSLLDRHAKQLGRRGRGCTSTASNKAVRVVVVAGLDVSPCCAASAPPRPASRDGRRGWEQPLWACRRAVQSSSCGVVRSRVSTALSAASRRRAKPAVRPSLHGGHADVVLVRDQAVAHRVHVPLAVPSPRITDAWSVFIRGCSTPSIIIVRPHQPALRDRRVSLSLGRADQCWCRRRSHRPSMSVPRRSS